ncbi:hypothetical protein QYF36_012707 [Acer negundo]|nr:hypothetical protein QYF36_012707 [Acer negundo]
MPGGTIQQFQATKQQLIDDAIKFRITLSASARIVSAYALDTPRALPPKRQMQRLRSERTNPRKPQSPKDQRTNATEDTEGVGVSKTTIRYNNNQKREETK